MTKLISQREAAKLLHRAYDENRKHPRLRVGQNLWNFIAEDYPDLVQQLTVGGPHDFFYEKHVPTVIETFYQYYVEK